MNTSTTSRIVAVALLALASVLSGGCGFTQGKKDAEAVLARHFQTIATNGFDTAMADYGATFFQKTTKEEWTKALTKLSSKLGTYQSHTLTGWRVFKNAGMTGAGTTVSLLCLVCAGVTYLTKEQRASRGFLIAAGIFFGSGLVLSIVGKVLGEKYGFP